MISIDIYDFWNNMSSKKNNFSLEEFIKDYFDENKKKEDINVIVLTVMEIVIMKYLKGQ